MLVQIFIMSTFQPAWFVESSMNEIDSAVRLFTFIGYGGTSATSFMRHLTVRSLQLVGRCKGPCHFFGTGAYQMGNLAIRRISTEAVPPMEPMRQIFLCIKPILVFLVACHLGPEWTVLIHFQTFQGLCCEYRKWVENDHEDERFQRRPGCEERAKLYMAWLETFCKDWGLPAKRERMICEQCPSDNFPEGACPRTLSNMLDLFEAQLLRFSRLLRFKRSPVRAGGKRIFESCDFKKARINQFTWQLDSGSLATWSLVLRKLLTDPAKARDFDISWQGDDKASTTAVIPPSDHGQRWSEVLLNLACSVSLVPVGSLRCEVGWVSGANATPAALLAVLTKQDFQDKKDKKKPLWERLVWPFGRACDFEWRRPPVNVHFGDDATVALVRTAAKA